MNAKDSTQDDDGRLPVEGGPLEPDTAAGDVQDLRDGTQPGAEGQEAALAEEDGPASTLTHVRSATFGPRRDARVVHAGYLFWNGARLDGRTRPERILRQRCEAIAHDKGYRTFGEMPAVMRGAVEAYARLWVVSDMMWAAFVGGGRLPDAFLDFQSMMHRRELHLGLRRELRDARDPAAILAGQNGAREGR